MESIPKLTKNKLIVFEGKASDFSGTILIGQQAKDGGKGYVDLEYLNLAIVVFTPSAAK